MMVEYRITHEHLRWAGNFYVAIQFQFVYT